MIASPLASSIARPAAERAHVASSLDPDAAAYVAALVSAGASVSPIQRAAIGAFVVGEKSALRWDAIKRCYLPIWGVTAANAICLRSLTSGTFAASGVTHATGYANGDRTSGFFNTGATPAALGITNASASMIRGIYIPDTLSADNVNFDSAGCYQTGDDRYHLSNGLPLNEFNWHTGVATGVARSVPNATKAGIVVGSSLSTSSRYCGVLRTSGWEISPENTVLATSPLAAQNIYFLARNAGGAAERHTDAGEFFWACGTGLELSDMQAVATSIKTLWETCTGLTLP